MEYITREQYNQIVWRDIRERDQFMPDLIRDLRNVGWRVYHTWNSQHSPDGFPDIVAVRRERLLIAELKRVRRSKKDDPTPNQQLWLADLARVERIDVRLWRPDDRDEIIATIV